MRVIYKNKIFELIIGLLLYSILLNERESELLILDSILFCDFELVVLGYRTFHSFINLFKQEGS